jgi:hypothetical protein
MIKSINCVHVEGVREDGSYTLYEYDAAVRLSKETSIKCQVF